MNQAFLLLGGNIGNRKENLANARSQLGKKCGSALVASRLYETAAWGKADQPAFLNQALKLGTSLAAAELMNTILEIELQMGRRRDEKYGPRIIDIDILLFNDEIIDLDFLKIPHPRMQDRRFVLVPLAEIAAGVSTRFQGNRSKNCWNTARIS